MARRTPDPPAARSARDDVRQRILATVDSIPHGRVATYGQVAEEAGLPRRARLVGKLLGELPTRSAIPWHRVLRASGEIAPRGDGGSVREQARRLRREGVVVSGGSRVSLERYRWGDEEPDS